MRKKIISMALVGAMAVLAMTGCGSKKSDVYNVGICQLVQHPALDAATQGFKDALTEKLGADKVKFDEQDAAGDSATCATIVNGFVANKVDLILSNATAPLQAASAATTEIPILGTSVTDYATALDIANWSGATGINVSGTSDLAPLDQQAEMILELVPDAKTVGLIYCSAEANSKYQVDVVRGILEGKGLTVKDYSFADTNDLQAVVTTACDESDVLYVPTDNAAASAAETIDAVASAAGKAIIAGEEGICQGCGIATLSISYYDLGYVTGEMAYEILVNGADPATMDVRFASSPTKKYVASRCDALGIVVPDGYEAIE